MGLLDDLLGQLGGGTPQDTRAPAQASTGPGMGVVLMALAPIVLSMLRNTGGAAQPGSAASTGGGLGGLLEQFRRAGFGEQVSSWVGRGQNKQLPPGALEQAFGRGGLADIARAAGVSEEDASRGLSQLIPEMVDRVTPDGQLPDGNSLLANLSELSRRLGRA